MIDFKEVRQKWSLPPYPPYHTGLYLEEYFYSFYKNNKAKFDEIGFTLIPIYWTTAYLNGIKLDRYINALPKHLRYFAISQHDDAIKESLPQNTVVFSAGGNSGGIPIPLVCSRIPLSSKVDCVKDIFCSFVGSITHNTREQMCNYLGCDNDFTIITDVWKWNIDKQKQDNFLSVMSRSKFTLCPRGYGAQSFRFYEALQLGSVPIYIHDDTVWKPYNDEVDWNKFCVSIHIKEISSLKHILKQITDRQYLSMLQEGKRVYEDFFQLNKQPRLILHKLKSYGLG